MSKKHYKESIQYKFLKDISVILFASTFVLSTVIAINERRMLRDSQMAEGRSFASIIANMSEDSLIMKNSIQLDSIVNEAKKEKDIVYIFIQDAHGKFITSQYAGINYQSPGLAAIISELSKASSIRDSIAAIKKKETIAEISVPIVTGSYVIGMVTIGMSQYNIHKQVLEAILFVIGLNLIVTFALVTVLLIASKKRILDPVIEIGRAAARIAKGELSAHVRIKSTGEIQALVNNFNQMAGDLDKTTVSRKSLQTIIDSMPYGIIIIDKEKNILAANRAALALTGYDTEDRIRGMACCNSICPDDKDKCPILDLGQKVDKSERILITKTGKRVPILKTVVPIELNGKEVLLEAVLEITDQKLAEEGLQKSGEEAKRIAQENATIADIGRIISSTLKIEDIYERFVEEVQKLIPFDRISINFTNHEERTSTIAYTSGIELAGHLKGVAIPLAGTIAEEVLRTRSSVLIQGEDIKKIAERFPNASAAIYTEIQSIIAAPLISKDIIGVLLLFSLKPDAYTEEHLRLAERVSNQIAGAIANAQLFSERMKAEEALQRSEEEAKRIAQENATIADIGKIISSSLNINEIYGLFAEEIRKLILFDRLAVNIININEGTFETLYMTGIEVAEHRPGKIHPLAGTLSELIAKRSSGLIIQANNEKEIAGLYPHFSNILRTGIRSKMSVPLISKDQVMGALHFRSTKANAYTNRDLKLAESIAAHIAGAISNAQLFSERMKAEKALRDSEESAKRIAQENAIMSEIGRIISSSLNINDVYERFTEKVRELVPLDRLTVNIFNPKDNTCILQYTSGIAVPGRTIGDVIPLEGSLAGEVMRTRSTLLIQEENMEYFLKKFDNYISSVNAGIRSIMITPLISIDEVIGALHFRSLKPNAYTEEHLRLAERVGNQIAGAIANAQLFSERMKTEEALQESEKSAKQLAQENTIMSEIGLIISSTLNIEEIYERFSGEVSKLIFFDRLVVSISNLKEQTITIAYAAGMDVPGRRQGDVIPLSGSLTEEIIRRKSGILTRMEDEREFAGSYPSLVHAFMAGIRLMMTVPLISKNEAFGSLHFWSLKPDAYTEEHLRLAGRIGNQIAGAIANAQLFKERIQTEEEKAALEEQLRQSQKMEGIGRLAGGIAHDFNNLLTIIKGYSQLSLLKINDDDPLKKDLEEIKTASERAADLTRQLLAFSRRQILEFKIIDLNTILQNLDTMLRRLIGEDVELVYLFSDDLRKIRTDPGQIEQVILNLALNARDAMPSGGKLTIETANVDMNERYVHTRAGITPGHYVMLSVTDTGVGMSPEIQEHLFEPFFTTKEVGKGTGLGLSTAYGIIKQSKGEITVYSEPDRGTTFKIYLPGVEEETSVLDYRDEKVPIPLGKETVLLVEDEPSVRGLAARVLREKGYSLLEAANGEDALRIIQEQAGKEIHLLLTDVVMPRMGGKELADRVRALRPEIKVLFASGYTDNAVVHRDVLDSGAEFLQKPFSPAALAHKVREVLDK